MLGQVFAQIKSGVAPTHGSWALIAGELGMLERACEPLGLTSTLAQIARVKPIFLQGSPSIPLDDFGREVIEVQIRLNDELKARTLFLLTVEGAGYFADHHFSPSIIERFPDASFDIDEAGKCYALERSTACVFHLMRVTELGLQEIARLLGMTDFQPTWEPIIRKIDNELKAKYEDRKFKGSSELLANISTHVHAVKMAWRNRTMHVDKKHTMEEAREIYHATCGLMRYIAENLPAKQPAKPGIVQTIRGIISQ